MKGLPGVYSAVKKDGSTHYRASVTYRSKHISLGSYRTEEEAARAYQEAAAILFLPYTYEEKEELKLVDEYLSADPVLAFDKWILLKNFKENGMYCRNPIYLKKRYFIYYLDLSTPLKFDADDLFYYMSHKIMRRGRHLFAADYGMQVNLLSRYGIRSHAVPGRDYQFINGDDTDFRYQNIQVINRYYGVCRQEIEGKPCFLAKIHVKGDLIVGRYATEIEAAAAYNKAADLLKEKGIPKNFFENYIEGLNEAEYARIYAEVQVSRRIAEYEM